MLLVTFVAIDILSFSFYFYVLGYIYVEKKAPLCKNGKNTPRTLLAMPVMFQTLIFIVLHLWSTYCVSDTRPYYGGNII